MATVSCALYWLSDWEISLSLQSSILVRDQIEASQPSSSQNLEDFGVKVTQKNGFWKIFKNALFGQIYIYKDFPVKFTKIGFGSNTQKLDLTLILVIF